MNRDKQIEGMARELYNIVSARRGNGSLRDWRDWATDLYNAGYRKQIEWISVDERLPERAGAYLTYTFRGYTKLSHFEEWAIGEKPFFDDYTVTHWMPLPEPPKMKGGE